MRGTLLLATVSGVGLRFTRPQKRVSPTMAGVVASLTVGAPPLLQVEARRRWKGTLLNTKRRPKKARVQTAAAVAHLQMLRLGHTRVPGFHPALVPALRGGACECGTRCRVFGSLNQP
jgi:hypothetical protein